MSAWEQVETLKRQRQWRQKLRQELSELEAKKEEVAQSAHDNQKKMVQLTELLVNGNLGAVEMLELVHTLRALNKNLAEPTAEIDEEMFAVKRKISHSFIKTQWCVHYLSGGSPADFDEEEEGLWIKE